MKSEWSAKNTGHDRFNGYRRRNHLHDKPRVDGRVSSLWYFSVTQMVSESPHSPFNAPLILLTFRLQLLSWISYKLHLTHCSFPAECNFQQCLPLQPLTWKQRPIPKRLPSSNVSVSMESRRDAARLQLYLRDSRPMLPVTCLVSTCLELLHTPISPQL